MLALALPRASSSSGGVRPPAALNAPAPLRRPGIATPFDFAARHDEPRPLHAPAR